MAHKLKRAWRTQAAIASHRAIVSFVRKSLWNCLRINSNTCCTLGSEQLQSFTSSKVFLKLFPELKALMRYGATRPKPSKFRQSAPKWNHLEKFVAPQHEIMVASIETTNPAITMYLRVLMLSESCLTSSPKL